MEIRALRTSGLWLLDKTVRRLHDCYIWLRDPQSFLACPFASCVMHDLFMQTIKEFAYRILLGRTML